MNGSLLSKLKFRCSDQETEQATAEAQVMCQHARMDDNLSGEPCISSCGEEWMQTLRTPNAPIKEDKHLYPGGSWFCLFSQASSACTLDALSSGILRISFYDTFQENNWYSSWSNMDQRQRHYEIMMFPLDGSSRHKCALRNARSLDFFFFFFIMKRRVKEFQKHNCRQVPGSAQDSR